MPAGRPPGPDRAAARAASPARSASTTGMAVRTAPHSRAAGTSRDSPSRAARDHRWRDRLHRAVADRPGRDEAGHLHVVPAEAVEKHRQADDEPHIARAEHEDARRRHQVDGARLGEQLAEALRRLRLAERARQATASRRPARRASIAAISHSARAEADHLQQQAADEEAGALRRVLRAGEPGDPAEQLPRALRRCRLDRAISTRSWSGPWRRRRCPAPPPPRRPTAAAPQAGIERRQHAAARRSASIRPVISMRGMPKRDASQPPPRLAKMPAVSYSRNRNASMNGV